MEHPLIVVHMRRQYDNELRCVCAGCMLPTAVVTERAWEKDQRKRLQGYATAAMTGKSRRAAKPSQGIPAGRYGPASQPPEFFFQSQCATGNRAGNRQAAFRVSVRQKAGLEIDRLQPSVKVRHVCTSQKPATTGTVVNGRSSVSVRGVLVAHCSCPLA